MDNINFEFLFRKYRLRSEIDTLTEFGNLLAKEGFQYETSIFSRWQHGTRLPSGRVLLLTILKIFINRGGIKTTDEVNTFLETANQGYITQKEQKQFFNLQ